MLYKNKKPVKTGKKLSTKYLLLGLAGLVIIILIFLFITGKLDNWPLIGNSAPTGSGTVPSTNTSSNVHEQTPVGDKNNSSSDDSSPPSSDQTSETIPLSKLLSPYGTFVSNHYPSLSSQGAPSQEESTCISNPGVSCYIQFTKGDVTKKLAPQITGNDGATSWDWDVKKAGLTTGDWTITAYVSSGDNTKSKQDSIKLQVSK